MSSQNFPNQVVVEQHNQGTPCQQQELQHHQDAGLQIALLQVQPDKSKNR